MTASPNALPVLPDLPPPAVVFGTSASMARVKAASLRSAELRVSLLLVGDSGTGREIIARSVHRQCSPENGGFVRITCPAITAGALKGELSLQAERRHGTIFFDEVAELDHESQFVLLDFVDRLKHARRNYAAVSMLHIVSSTSSRLQREVEQGTFNRSLYHRLRGVEARVPSLAERREDLDILATYLLDYYSLQYGIPVAPISPELLESMSRYHFPGNIRELENVILRHVIMDDDGELIRELAGNTVLQLAVEIPAVGKGSLGAIVDRVVRQIEETVIRATLEVNRAHRRKTAAALHISYRSLLYKLRSYGVAPLRRTSGTGTTGAAAIG